MPTVSNASPDRLIETFRSYSHAISAEVLRKYLAVDRDDIVGAAELGLVEAANNFDTSRGVLFKTFAYYRIRGAIYDSLRKLGWFAKDAARLRFESGADEFLKDYADIAPPASSPDASAQELQDLTTSVVNCYFLSLTSMAEERYMDREISERLREALAKLPEKNREVLEAYYFQDETLESIGKRLGLSKSWLSRLHAKSLEMLRTVLEEAGVVG